MNANDGNIASNATYKRTVAECTETDHKMPKIMISLKDLSKVPCPEYNDVIIERYGDDGTFDPLGLIDEIGGSSKTDDTCWLITNCSNYQTPEMVEYFKSLDPNADNVSWLIAQCEYCQTPEMIEYYKSLDPSIRDVHRLIVNCVYCQTPEMIEYYKSLGTNANHISWLIVRCKFCQTPEMVDYFKSLNPKPDNVKWLMTHCEYCETDEMKPYANRTLFDYYVVSLQTMLKRGFFKIFGIRITDNLTSP